MTVPPLKCDLAIIGAGPAGLMAAEVASSKGLSVHVFERMPTPARKFLMAGKSGLNITHTAPADAFMRAYGADQPLLEAAIEAFSPAHIRAWMTELGIESFVGSSGRVFPRMMKASPLLRAWIKRLQKQGVQLHTRHIWQGGLDPANLVLMAPGGEQRVEARALVLALGGASWPRLGGDGRWQSMLPPDIAIEPLAPSNCGFAMGWSHHFSAQFHGTPVKTISAAAEGTESTARTPAIKGDLIVTRDGFESGTIYALTRAVRERLQSGQHSALILDLLPDLSESTLTERLSKPRGKRSLSTHLKRTVGLSPVKLGLMREAAANQLPDDPASLAQLMKRLRLPIQSLRPIEEAISSAGGVCFSTLDAHLMAVHHPGVFFAGEMVNWDAPTGGYLLTACLAQGRQAAHGAINWLGKTHVI